MGMMVRVHWWLALALLPIACAESSASDPPRNRAGAAGISESGASGDAASGTSGAGAPGGGGGAFGGAGNGGRSSSVAGKAGSRGEVADAGESSSGGDVGVDGGSAGGGTAGNAQDGGGAGGGGDALGGDGGGDTGGGGNNSPCVTGDVFDPGEVYLQGTLQEGLCGVDAIAHWSCPDLASTGFSCDVGAALLRENGRLLYPKGSDETIREFRCDLCPFESDPGADYPDQTEANDVGIALPCETTFFKSSPDGREMYLCQGTWYELGGIATYQSVQYELLHLGYDGLALTTGQVANLVTGAASDLSGLPFYTDHLGYRARPGGFWVAAYDDEISGRPVRLFEVGANGATTPLGTYPPLPSGFSLFAESALERGGALVQAGSRNGTFEDVVVRRTLQGESKVVYDEALDPLVKLHISYLITGP